MVRTTCLVLLILGLGFGSLGVFAPGWAAAVGLDVWNLPSDVGNLRAERRLADELKAKERVMTTRIAAKQRVITELLAERLTLIEAAARFRTLNEESDRPINVAELFPAQSEGESYCRQVLRWVRAAADESTADHGAVILSRLEVELKGFLVSHDGDVVLPTI
jgi:hypothetical protein